MKKMLLLVLAMIVLMSSTVFANSWSGEGKGKECPVGVAKEHSQCPIMEKFMKKTRFLLENKSEIGLSDEQVKTIKGLKLQIEKSEVQQRADRETFILDLKSELAEDKIDVEGANKLIDGNFDAAATAAKANFSTYAKLKGLLTSDQVTKMKALHEQMEKKKKEEGKEK